MTRVFVFREQEVFCKARLVIMDSLKLASESDAAIILSYVYYVQKNYLDDPSYSIIVQGCMVFLYSAVTSIRGNGELVAVPRNCIALSEDQQTLVVVRSPHVKTRGYVQSNKKSTWFVGKGSCFYEVFVSWRARAHQVDSDRLFSNFKV